MPQKEHHTIDKATFLGTVAIGEHLLCALYLAKVLLLHWACCSLRVIVRLNYF